MSPQSLSEAELESVRELLDRFGDKRAMNLEQLDGFLAALSAVQTRSPKAGTCAKFGEKRNEAAFTAQPILQDFANLYNASSGRHSPYTRSRVTFSRHCYLQMNTASLMAVIGQVVSCVEWSCAKKIGTPLLDDRSRGRHTSQCSSMWLHSFQGIFALPQKARACMPVRRWSRRRRLGA